MRILGIESSCDESAVAIIENGTTVLADRVSSQTALHAPYGGVVPELASRRHVEILNLLLEQALADAQLSYDDLDAIAVTRGPGLLGSLLVGVMCAKTLAWDLQIPLIGVHHLEAHLYANFLVFPELEPPLLTLLVSGGHSLLVLMEAHGRYRVLGQTLDDAVGEAYDKVARLLDLPYPGGPPIDREAQNGNPKAFDFPRAHLENPFDMSFSGLKTAVLYTVKRLQEKGEPLPVADLAASFQHAVVMALMKRIRLAVEETGVTQVAIAGGVAANSGLRNALEAEGQARGWQTFIPPRKYCTDNGVMIAAAGHHYFQQGRVSDLSLTAISRMPLPYV